MTTNTPSLVTRARQLASSLGCFNSCLDEVGQFLHILAGHVRGGRIAEFGTGCGVGTAWLAASGNAQVYSVDSDESRVNAVRSLFTGVDHVHLCVGDWTDILQDGPYALVFVDAKPAKLSGIERIVAATEPGGFIVMDDLTPPEFWPEAWNGKADVVRETWLNHVALESIEIRTSIKVSVILARRK